MGTAKWAEVRPQHEVEQERETSAWLLAHRALSRLAQERAAADAEEGRWLLAAVRSAAHLHLGFGSFSEYVERSFGYKPRSTQEKLRVAEALEELPVLAQALEQGTLHWSAVRELTRVAVPENEQEWLAIAHGKSVRQLEELVAGKGLGDDPSSPSRASERRHVLRFEVAPETFALFREAMTALRRSTDDSLDDDAALLALARLALGGPRDEGRASYQIAVTVCAECGRGQQPANGELVSIDSDIVTMAQCDGQHLGCIVSHAANDGTPLCHPDPNIGAHVGAAAYAASDAERSDAERSDAERSDAERSDAEHSDAERSDTERSDAERSDAERSDAGLPASAGARERIKGHMGAHAHEDAPHADAHVGATASLAPSAVPLLARATQTIPPALRRAVLARDHHRCVVPGCRNAVFLDVHHLRLRSEGGRNDADNLITLCGAHHRAAHRGALVVEGISATGLRFRHADGSPYGRVRDPHAHEARAKAFRALCGLGFRERDVRAALAQLEREGKLAAATTEHWLRAGLALLSRPRSRP